jgi:hypothetical protein
MYFMDYVNIVAFFLLGLLKLAGALVFGLAIGKLGLDILKKGEHPWQFQIAFFLGTIALLIASLRFAHIFLGGMSLGVGIAVLIWGLPKKSKEPITK